MTHTGEPCAKTASYHSHCHPDIFAELKEGDAFPRCTGGDNDPHDAEWIYAVAGPNLSAAVDGERPSDP